MKKTEEWKVKYIIENPQKSSTQLSEELNIPKSTIRGITKRHGLDKTIKRKQIDITELKEEYEKCGSVKLISEKFDIDRHYCSKLLNKSGVVTNRAIQLTKGEIDDIVLECNYESIASVAKRYNLSDSFLSKEYLLRKEDTIRKKSIPIKINEEYDTFFTNINDINSYYLGLLASDGCVFIRPNGNSIINLSLHKQDISILEKFFKDLGINKKLYHSNLSNAVNAQIASKQIANDLQKYNIVPNKSWTYEPVDLGSMELNWSFVRGYFDGDGSIDNKYCVSFCGNLKTMEWFKEYLNRFGIKTCLMQDKRKDKYKHDFYTLSISNIKSTYIFGKLIYLNCDDRMIHRKHNRFIEFFEKVELNKTNRKENLEAVKTYNILKENNYETKSTS